MAELKLHYKSLIMVPALPKHKLNPLLHRYFVLILYYGRDHVYVNSDYNSLLNVTRYLGPDKRLSAKPAHDIELRSIMSYNCY